MNKVFYSVIIPARNSSNTIQECLESVVRQDYTNFEIIVVDDNSTDNTYQIASKFSKVILLDKQSGAGKARNIGAANARGDIFVFLDSDCRVEPDYLGRLHDIFRKENPDVITGGYDKYLDENKISKFNFYELTYRRRNLSGYIGSFSSHNLAIKREVFLDIGGFPEYILGAAWEDMEFSLKLTRKYNILWSNELGIGHHFKTVLKDYLRQQAISTSGSVVLILRYPWQLFKRTNQSSTYPEVISTVLFPIFVFFTIFNKIFFVLAAAAFAIVFLINIHFLLFIRKTFKEKFNFLVGITPLIILRNINWVFSIITGFIYLIKYFRYKKVRL